MEASNIPILNLTCHFVIPLSYLVVAEDRKFQVFWRPWTRYFLILWHFQQPSILPARMRYFAVLVIKFYVHDTVSGSLQPSAFEDTECSPWWWWCWWPVVLLEAVFVSKTNACYSVCETLSDYSWQLFFLAELKSLKGWVLSLHGDPEILKRFQGWRAWTEGITRSPVLTSSV